MRRATLIAAALVAGFAPLPRGAVDRLYSRGFYAAFQPLTTRLSNTVGFALFDLLLVVAACAVAVAVVALIRDGRRRGWFMAGGAFALNIAAASAAGYLAFLVAWGWNYRALPLEAQLDYSAARVSQARASALARSSVDALNDLYGPAHAAGWTTIGLIDPDLAAAFADVTQALGRPQAITVGRPKTTLLEPYFRRAGVSGMTDPFFLETLVDSTLLPFERPLVIAHEWAHLAGYADEGEANFVGWLTCVRAGPAERYSGWLFLYDELLRALPPRDRAAFRAALEPGVASDLRAVAERLERNVNPAIATAGWRVYDRYLKANRVAEGAASYDMVVRLVLGVRFEDGWRPAVLRRE